MTIRRHRLYFCTGIIARFSFAYEKVDNTDRLQPSGCNGSLVRRKNRIKTEIEKNDMWYGRLCHMFY